MQLIGHREVERCSGRRGGREREREDDAKNLNGGSDFLERIPRTFASLSQARDKLSAAKNERSSRNDRLVGHTTVLRINFYAQYRKLARNVRANEQNSTNA